MTADFFVFRQSDRKTKNGMNGTLKLVPGLNQKSVFSR